MMYAPIDLEQSRQEFRCHLATVLSSVASKAASGHDCVDLIEHASQVMADSIIAMAEKCLSVGADAAMVAANEAKHIDRTLMI